MKKNVTVLLSLLVTLAFSLTAFADASPGANGPQLTTNQKKASLLINLASGAFDTYINDGEEALQKVYAYGTLHTFGSMDAKLGAVSFIPVEYWIANDDPAHPWLRIDVYRLGIGGRADEIYKAWATLSNSAFIKLTTGQPHLYNDLNYVQDLILVHPSSTPPVENIKHLIVMNINFPAEFKNVVHGLTEKLIDDPTFAPGDLLITNSTISAGPTYDTNPGWLAFGPGASAGLTFARTHQISVLKTGDNQVVAQWSNIHDLNLNLEAGVRALFFSAPVLGFKEEFSNGRDRGFSFDLSDAGQKASLLANLHTATPVFQTPPTPVTDRRVFQQLTTYLVSALGLKTWSHSDMKRHEIDYGPNGPDQELYEKIMSSRKRSFWYHSYLLDDQSVATAKVLKMDPTKKGLTSADKLNLTVTFTYDKQYATTSDYQKLYSNLVTIMPRSMQAITPDQFANPALGHLTFRGDVQFTSSAINEIFASHLTTEQMCEDFYKTLPVTVEDGKGQPWPATTFCQTFIPKLRPPAPGEYVDDRPIRPGEALQEVSKLNIQPSDKASDIAQAINETDSYITAFDRAQTAIEKARAGKGSLQSAADAIQGLGTGTSLLKVRVETLQGRVKSAKVIREATITTDAGTINHPNAIVLPAEDQNGSAAAEEALGLTKTAIETALYNVRRYFYNQFYQATPRIGLQNIGNYDAAP